MYTIIGNGRLAQHIIFYFRSLDINFSHWYRNASISLEESLRNSSHVLLLINDQQIDPFIIENPQLQKYQLIHCSGAHISGYARTAHPLMTFNNSLYEIDEYKKIPFILEKEGPSFAELLPGLPNPHAYISRASKPYYHALCVMANNFTTLLWQKLFLEFQQRFQLSEDMALPLLKRTCENLQLDHRNALSGPLVRNDNQTIKKNLQSLMEDDFFEVYRAFVNATSEGTLYENSRFSPEKTT